MGSVAVFEWETFEPLTDFQTTVYIKRLNTYQEILSRGPITMIDMLYLRTLSEIFAKVENAVKGIDMKSPAAAERASLSHGA